MLRLSLEEFKEEVKAEMYGYEEIEKSAIDKWFKTLDSFLAAKKKSSIFKYKNGDVMVELKDESDLFMVVDRYLAAIVNEDLDKYFTDWSL